MIVVAYGLLLPQAILDIPKRGCINVHASILPRWRGAAPIERALLAGDAETGVTIMQMDAGLDTGNMLYVLKTDIGASDTREMLESRLAEIGCAGLLHTLCNLDKLQLSAQVQNDSLSTYAKKLDKTEALIDWKNTSSQIDLVVRAGIGRNPAYSFLNGQRVRIMQARPVENAIAATPGRIIKLVRGHTCIAVACGEGALELEVIQLPGKNPVHVEDLLNGHSPLLTDGAILSQQENS
jgi:methionyl-tRNA formyltransferase